MMTSQPSVRVASVLFAVVVWSAPGLTRAAPPPPAPSGEVSFTEVSGTLADIAGQQAERGRRYEQEGKYVDALREYREAMAGLDKFFATPSNHATGNPKAFLVRGGAAVDAARALSRIPGHNRDEVRGLTDRAELDFDSVVNNSKSDAVGRDLIQKAMLGRGYARLLRGDLEGARTDFAGVRYAQTLGHMVTPQQVQGAITRIDTGLAAQAKAPPEPATKPKKDKRTALMTLGQEIVKSLLPRYHGFAMAIGDVVEAYRK